MRVDAGRQPVEAGAGESPAEGPGLGVGVPEAPALHRVRRPLGIAVYRAGRDEYGKSVLPAGWPAPVNG